MIDPKEVCHAIKLKFCRGKLLDPPDTYGSRAYWCAELKDGYHAQECKCKKESRNGKVDQR